MKKRARIRDMVLGALIATLLFGLAATALAALTPMDIQVFTGVKVYVDDQLVDPRNVNGEPVDVLAYNGTTYLPIRAVGNALGLAVQYDAATQSAYLGRHAGAAPAFYLDEFDYFSGTAERNFQTAASEQDNTQRDHSHCITDDFERTYLLNGQYSRLTGNLYQTYQDRSDSIRSGCGLWIYGDGKLLYTKEINEETTGFRPETIDLDLTGVLELRVVFVGRNNYLGGSNVLSLGEMALYT